MHVRTLPADLTKPAANLLSEAFLDYPAFLAIGSRRPGLRRANTTRPENPAYYRRLGLEVVHDGDLPRGTFGAGFVPDSARRVGPRAPVSLHAAARRSELPSNVRQEGLWRPLRDVR
jgi:hypothetical protein